VGRVKSPFLIKTFDIVPSCRIEGKSIIVGKNSVANSIQKRYNEERVELKMRTSFQGKTFLYDKKRPLIILIKEF